MSDKPKKTRKVQRASDGVITSQHIANAQQSVLQFGLTKMFATVDVLEPDLAGFMSAVAEHMAAHAMFEYGIPRGAAMVYSAQHDAVYSYYQDIIRGTPVAALDKQPFPALPAEGEEGGACAEKK
jgi:hypothetical protein